MTRAEWTSLAIFAAIGVLFIADKAGANETHLDHYYEERMEQLGSIAFPPMIEGSYQRIHPNGLIFNSNVRDNQGRICRMQVGMDGNVPILFEHCDENMMRQQSR